MDLFEQAARQQFRFDSVKGQLTVEDLFALPLTSITNRLNLNDIAKGLHREVKANAEESDFVSPASAARTANAITEAKLEIVKRVIAVRVEERDAAAASLKRREEKQKIMALIADKKDEALKGKSLEDLEALLNAL
jgi:hypothetical protein